MDRSSGSQTLVEHRATLEAFARALRREGHVLAKRPDLLWQQLYNRLQWADEPIVSLLTPELARRTARGARPWLRLGAPFRESEALIRSLEGHGDVVVDCAISPDGTFIISASWDKTLRIWDVRTGTERLTLEHPKGLTRCAISPDGSYVVGAAGDNGLHVWDARSGVRRATLLGWSAEHRAWGISPDGSLIVSALEDHSLRIWDARTGAVRVNLAGHAVAQSTYWEDQVQAGEDRNTVSAALAWGIAEGAVDPKTLLPADMVPCVTACAISPDGTWLVSSSADGTLKPWDAETGAGRATLWGHQGRVNDRAISPDGTWIVSAGEDSTLRVWDARTRAERAVLRGHSGAVAAGRISADGSFIVSGGADHTVRIWDAETGTERAVLRGHQGRVSVCQVSRDGTLVATASPGRVPHGRDHTLKLWDARTGSSWRRWWVTASGSPPVQSIPTATSSSRPAPIGR